MIRPARAVRPTRRSSAASRSAPGSATVVSPSLTSEATTRSPGLRSSPSPAAVPITTIAPNGFCWLLPTDFRARVAPMPVCSTWLVDLVRPRRTAFASMRSGARTSRPGFADSGAASNSIWSAAASFRGCGMVSVMGGTPHVSTLLLAGNNPPHPDKTALPLAGGGPPTPDKPPQSRYRKRQPVQVVVKVEVTREAGSCEVGLVPRAVPALRACQPADAALCRLAVPLPCRQQGQQGPGGLRSGGRALRRPGGRVVVGAQVLSPAAVVVLHRFEPGDRLADLRLTRLDAGGDQRGHRRAGAVQGVGAPAAEPGAVRLLVLQQPDDAAAAGGLGGQALGREGLDDVRGDIGAGRVDDRPEVTERQLVDQLAGVVGVERAPAAVLAL